MSEFITVSSPAQAAASELEAPLSRLEHSLDELTEALRRDDAQGLEEAADELQQALTAAVDRFRLAARRGGVPVPMKQRLAMASAHVAAQRESLARATAALDRAIDVLLPPAHAAYGAAGHTLRQASTGYLQA